RRVAAQAVAQRQAWRRIKKPIAQIAVWVTGRRQPTLLEREARRGITRRSRYEHSIPRSPSRTQERCRLRDMTQNLNRDRQRSRSCITADERHIVSASERSEPGCKFFQPRLIYSGKSQRQQRPGRSCPHGGQIAQVHCEYAVTD